MANNFVSVIPAAGDGSRFSTEIPKQFLRLEGRTILELSIKPLLDFSECLGICVAMPLEGDYSEYTNINNSKVNFIKGGKNRLDSVIEGIKYWRESGKIFTHILVHDAVRPCLKSSDVRSLLKTMDEEDLDGAILGVPCGDTIKKISGKEKIIENTISRKDVWLAYTPQIFKKSCLYEALVNNNLDPILFTDEASLIEINSGKIKVVACSRDNIKVTFQEDINLVKSILSSQGRMDN